MREYAAWRETAAIEKVGFGGGSGRGGGGREVWEIPPGGGERGEGGNKVLGEML